MPISQNLLKCLNFTCANVTHFTQNHTFLSFKQNKTPHFSEFSHKLEDVFLLFYLIPRSQLFHLVFFLSTFPSNFVLSTYRSQTAKLSLTRPLLLHFARSFWVSQYKILCVCSLVFAFLSISQLISKTFNHVTGAGHFNLDLSNVFSRLKALLELREFRVQSSSFVLLLEVRILLATFWLSATTSGVSLADLVVGIGTIDLVVGELDR